MKLLRIVALLLLAGFNLSAAMKLNPARAHDATCRELPNGEYAIATTGPDAYLFVANLPEVYQPARAYVFSVECKTDADTSLNAYGQCGKQTVFLPIGEVKQTNGWTRLLCDLTVDGKPRGAMQWFRIGFRSGPDAKHISVRNLRFVEADQRLRACAALGTLTDTLPHFGIKVAGAKAKQTPRELLRLSGKESTCVAASLYPPLDFDALTKDARNDPSAVPPVPLAPALVCGEGEHPQNHTVVRILSAYQVPEVQFLAYPPEITGGVGVAALKFPDGRPGFAAWPLACGQTSEIRLFNRAGGFVAAISVAKNITPPFAVCAGKFLPAVAGDQLAVTARHAKTTAAPISIYSSDGRLLKEILAPGQGSGECVLVTKKSPGADSLLVEFPNCRAYFQLNAQGEARPIPFTGAAGLKLFGSACADRAWNAAGPETNVSTLFRVNAQGQAQPLDAGRMENIFWFCKQTSHGGETARWQELPDAQYVRSGLYNFLGDAAARSPLALKGDIENKTFQEWVAGINWYESSNALPKNLPKHQRQLAQYDQGDPAVWALMFSHRWMFRAMKTLGDAQDPATGLPRYLALDRANHPHESGYFDKPLFRYGSQNFEQESLTALYHHAQRDFFRRLAPRYRANPEMTIAVEPSHENEIVSGPKSVGDYNPKSIADFFQYLLTLYGDLPSINRTFGTAFSENFFDAPRGLFRGPWDAYSPNNPYFAAWVEYGRTVVYRHVALAQRETLLAGFPPEMIKSHQIPDTFAVNNIGTGEGEPRITPIDWFLTAGTGYGFSRYGTDYKKPHNIHLTSHSSGFDGMLIGEYASLTPSADDAYGQLAYLRNHGVSTLHVMWWPTFLKGGAEANVAQDAGLRRLLQENNTPRPGYAGGIGEVRPYRGPSGAYDIASLGTQPENTGLIKSLRPDGSFEGSVYVTPFHAHVAVATLKKEPAFVLPPRGAKETKLCDLPPLRAGSVIEITATTANEIKEMEFSLTHRGLPFQGSAIALKDLPGGHFVRVIYKVPLVLDRLALHLSGNPGALSSLQICHHQDQAACITQGLYEGARHQGGVTFDVLE